MYQHQPKYVLRIALKRDEETYQHKLGQSMAFARDATEACFPIWNHLNQVDDDFAFLESPGYGWLILSSSIYSKVYPKTTAKDIPAVHNIHYSSWTISTS